METLRHLWTSLQDVWSSLSQGARDNVVGTLIGGLLITGLTTWLVSFRKSIAAGLRRFVLRQTAPETPTFPTTQPQELVIKIEQSKSTEAPLQPQSVQAQPAPEPATVSPSIPRAPVVGFVARRDRHGNDIVERLKEELVPDKNRLVALSGPGGVGKTTLAAEAAREINKSHRFRIVWISADGREDFAFSTLLNESFTQLGRADLRALEPELRAEYLETLIAANPTLIVLDNFETIANDEQTRCIEFLFARARCPALITTRQKIHLALNIAISVMSPEEADNFLHRLIEQASDPSAFAEIDRELVMKASERNPLVMQWVVAQIDLAQDADTVLDDLTHGAGDAAQRVFDRTFNLAQLGDDGRAALLALSLFAPDASRVVLAEVAGFGDDLRRLNEAVKHLANVGLVKSTAGGQRLAVEGLTRKLAEARLSKGTESAAFPQRYVRYFSNYATAHRRACPEDFDALEIERDNVLSAMDLAFSLKNWKTVTDLMDAITFDGVTGYLPARGYWDEARRRGEQALRAAGYLADTGATTRFSRSLAITLHELGRLAHAQGELAQARQLFTDGLALNQKLGDQRGIVTTLHELGRLAQAQGELAEARRLFQDGLEINKRLGDQAGVAIILQELGRLARAQGELDEARGLYHASMDIQRQRGNERGMAVSLHQLATLAHDQAELEEAHRLYDESLEFARRVGDENSIAVTLHQLGRLAVEEDNNAKAAQLFREAREIFVRLESPDAEMVQRSLKRVEEKSLGLTTAPKRETKRKRRKTKDPEDR